MNLVEYIKQNEGKRNKVYKCPAGFNTIGYGHNLDAKPLSNRVIELILEEDIIDVLKDIKGIIHNFDLLSEKRQTALIDMMFNLGTHGFSKFKKTIKAINSGDFEKASIEMLDSNYANQVPNRAKENARLMREG